MTAIGDGLAALYPWTLALHVMSVLAWMAGLFYLPRLYVYHVEAAAGRPELEAVFRVMERRLLRAIMNPAMVATWLFGLMLVFTPGLVDWSSGWPWIKTAAVLAMSWIHHLLALWRRDFEAGRNRRTGRFYRLLNEAPTLLMIVIVIMVIVRPF